MTESHLYTDEDGKRLVRVKYNLHPSDAEEMSRAGADVPSPVELRAPPSFRCPSLEVEQRMTCLDIQAQVRTRPVVRQKKFISCVFCGQLTCEQESPQNMRLVNVPASD